MRRIVVATVLIVLWLALVLAWSAGLRPGQPWQPASSLSLQEGSLHVISGAAEVTDNGLQVTDLGKFAQGLQTWTLAQPLQAGQWPALRYNLSGLPRSVTLALVFRSNDDPANVHTVTLPWPGPAATSIDLTAFPAWHGQITEIGFTQYPTPSLATRDAPTTPFVLHDARLESASMLGQLRSLRSRWCDWIPWSLSSPHTNASATPFHLRTSPVLTVALAVAGSLLLLLVCGLLRRRAWQRVLPVVLAGWLVLDALWLAQLQGNQALSASLYAGKPWSERRTMVYDWRLQQRADIMREVLATQPAGTPVLYWTPDESGKAIARLGYLLRPANVAPLPAGLGSDQLPAGALILINNLDRSWHWNADTQQMIGADNSFQGDLLWHQQDMFLLRPRAEAGS